MHQCMLKLAEKYLDVQLKVAMTALVQLCVSHWKQIGLTVKKGELTSLALESSKKTRQRVGETGTILGGKMRSLYDMIFMKKCIGYWLIEVRECRTEKLLVKTQGKLELEVERPKVR